jgi:arylsulfatase A-like enzyme
LRAQPAKPDIILIVFDDFRASDWEMLPKTRELVGGTEFPNYVHDSPVCGPSRATLLTGIAARHGGWRTNPGTWAAFAPYQKNALPVRLQQAGYWTVHSGKYVNGWDEVQPPGWSDWRPHDDKLFDSQYLPNGNYSVHDARNKLLNGIERCPAGQPFFAHLALHVPHGPYEPHHWYEDVDVEPARNDLDRARRRMLLSADDTLAAISGALGSRWDDAVVIVLADNGFMLGEHESNGGKPFWWDQCVRVPMLARLPGSSAGVDTRMVSSVDVFPTIVQAAGAEPAWPMDGFPLQDTWSREAVLTESRTTDMEGKPRTPFDAAKGDGWIYVEPMGGAPRFYRTEDEETVDHIADVDADSYAALLDLLTA